MANRSPFDEFDWEILRYVVDWAPYGGPHEEDILPRFGMDAQRLNTRFVELVTALSRHHSIVLTERQQRLLARARELVPSTSSRTRSHTRGIAGSARNSGVAFGLSPDDGRWTMRHGLWFWKQQAQHRS